MTAALVALENRLLGAFQEQLRHYDRALSIVEQSARASNDWVHALNAALQDIISLDAGMAHDKLAWRQSGRSPGKELAAVLDLLAQRIRLLSESIDRQVAELQARKQQLLPEIDGFIKERRMLQAYGKRGA
jgi:hypothetical protein